MRLCLDEVWKYSNSHMKSHGQAQTEVEKGILITISIMFSCPWAPSQEALIANISFLFLKFPEWVHLCLPPKYIDGSSPGVPGAHQKLPLKESDPSLAAIQRTIISVPVACNFGLKSDSTLTYCTAMSCCCSKQLFHLKVVPSASKCSLLTYPGKHTNDIM